jgi:hypothetical protein
MWFGRTPHLILARQKDWLIRAVEEVHWESGDFEAFAVERQHELRRLVWLLKEVRRIVGEKTKNGSGMLVAMEKGAPFQIFDVKDAHSGALPVEIVERFWCDKRLVEKW